MRARLVTENMKITLDESKIKKIIYDFYEYVKSTGRFNIIEEPHYEHSSFDGKSLEFEFESKEPIKNNPEMHRGEFAECTAGYSFRNMQFFFVFSNSGFTTEINSSDEFKKLISDF